MNDNKGEIKFTIVRHSPFMLITRLAYIQLAYLMCLILISLSGLFLSSIFPLFFQILLLFICLAIFMDIFIVYGIYYLWKNSYYEMRSNAIIYYRKGVFVKKIFFYTINENTDFILRQNFLGRYFNCGDIQVTGPTINEQLIIKDIPDPERYLNIFKELISTKGAKETFISVPMDSND